MWRRGSNPDPPGPEEGIECLPATDPLGRTSEIGVLVIRTEWIFEKLFRIPAKLVGEFDARPLIEQLRYSPQSQVTDAGGC